MCCSSSIENSSSVYREHHWHFDQTVFLSFFLLLLRLMVMVCPSMVLGAAGCWQCSPSLISSSRRRHCCICCNNNNNHHLQGLVFSFLSSSSFVFFFRLLLHSSAVCYFHPLSLFRAISWSGNENSLHLCKFSFVALIQSNPVQSNTSAEYSECFLQLQYYLLDGCLYIYGWLLPFFPSFLSITTRIQVLLWPNTPSPSPSPGVLESERID